MDAVDAFAAGVLSSIGPCIAPRLLALAAVVTNARRPLRLTAAFVTGLVAAYASFGLVGSLLGEVRALQTAIYALVACAAFVGGVRQLVVVGAHAHEHACDAHAPHGTTPSLGGAALLGASFAFVVSPCCTPLVVALVAYAGNVGSPSAAAALLAAFALGHALPLFAVAFGGARIGRIVGRVANAQAVAVVSGALLIGLGAYYGLMV
jgi:cytochrome c-type biogenesis protein